MKQLKLLFLTLIVIMLALPIVSAGTDIDMSGSYSIDPSNYIFWDNGDQIKNGTYRAAPANGDALTTQRWTTTGTSMTYDNTGAKNGNMSILRNLDKHNSFSINGSNMADITIQFTLFDNSTDISGGIHFIMKDKTSETSAQMGVDTTTSTSKYYYRANGFSGPNVASAISRVDTGINFTVYYQGTYVAIYINQTKVGNETTPHGNFSQLFFAGTDGITAHLDDILIWEGIPEDRPSVVSDTTPPEITSYNLTSDGGEGCTVWNTSKSTACDTSDTTPTIVVHTDINAYCAIGVSNLNYTGLINLGNERICSGTGTKEHTCTLIPEDQLTEETSYIYIGCENIWGYENSSSTSGALKVSILSSDLESYGRNAIETGVRDALSSGYTVYTDQKIYARNSANQQSVGVFDKVVKWMNKIWAFNFLTGNDTAVSMFNITPVLYTLEMRNITNSTVNTTVYNFIMSTK